MSEASHSADRMLPVIPWRYRVLQGPLFRVRPAALASILKRICGVRRLVVATSLGRFFIDPVSHLGLALTTEGEYEPGMTRTLREFLRPSHTFLDVGANEGYFSVLGGKLVGPTGRVVAVEPQPRLRPVLERNFALNELQNVMLIQSAISDREGDCPFFLAPDTNSGASGLAQVTRYRLPTVSVATMNLSTLLDRLELTSIDFMKMDIEGFEHEAVLGSPDVFRQRRVKAFALELHPTLLRNRGLDPDALPRFLAECGYKCQEPFGNTVYVVPG